MSTLEENQPNNLRAEDCPPSWTHSSSCRFSLSVVPCCGSRRPLTRAWYPGRYCLYYCGDTLVSPPRFALEWPGSLGCDPHTHWPLRIPFDQGSVVHLSFVIQLSHQCLLVCQWRSSLMGRGGCSWRRRQADFMCPTRTLQYGTQAHMKPIVSSVILRGSVEMHPTVCTPEARQLTPWCPSRQTWR